MAGLQSRAELVVRRRSNLMGSSCAVMADRARTARCKGRWTLPAFATQARPLRVLPLEWTSLPSGQWFEPPDCRRCHTELLIEGREDYGFGGPYIVKPRFGGSSIGIEVVEDVATAHSLRRSSVHLSGGAVLEPYRGDLFDLQIAARSWPKRALSSIERPLKVPNETAIEAHEILGYRDKYAGGEGMASAPRELPAVISSSLEEQIRSAAGHICDLCELRGVMRIDFLSDAESIWVNEVNTIPGSLARYLWIEPHVTFNMLLADLLSEARSQGLRPMHTYGADGSILQSASSISAKLA